jgi:hypothetical protein
MEFTMNFCQVATAFNPTNPTIFANRQPDQIRPQDVCPHFRAQQTRLKNPPVSSNMAGKSRRYIVDFNGNMPKTMLDFHHVMFEQTKGERLFPICSMVEYLPRFALKITQSCR